MKLIRKLYQWTTAILLILVYGKDAAIEIIRSRQSDIYKDQIAGEKQNFKLKKKQEELKTQLIQAIKQSEENEAMREKHFGPNPKRTAFVQKRNAEKMEKYFGKN